MACPAAGLALDDLGVHTDGVHFKVLAGIGKKRLDFVQVNFAVVAFSALPDNDIVFDSGLRIFDTVGGYLAAALDLTVTQQDFPVAAVN